MIELKAIQEGISQAEKQIVGFSIRDKTIAQIAAAKAVSYYIENAANMKTRKIAEGIVKGLNDLELRTSTIGKIVDSYKDLQVGVVLKHLPRNK